MTPLDGFFDDLSRAPGLRPVWFSLLKEIWMTDTLIGRYRPFGALAVEALRGLGETRGFAVSDERAEALIHGLTHLPAHADVAEGLAALSKAGFPLIAFSNGTRDGLATQLDHAGLTDHFERVFTVQSFHSYKPDPAVYRAVAEALDVTTARITMVAAHGWDLTGAAAAGCRTVFLARPGQPLTGVTPDYRSERLTDLPGLL